MRIVKIVILLCLFKAFSLNAQRSVNTLDSVLTIVAEQEMFHGQLLIAEKGTINFNKAYGIHQGVPISTRTPFNIQSITKGITATCVLMLVDKGMLSLDDRLDSFFPQLPYPGVTLHHLLTMTSGLPRFFETVLVHGDTSQVIDNTGILALISKNKPGGQPPGHVFNYNNTNYLLLASVIEKVTDQSYADFVDRNIFRPLNMRDSYAGNDQNQTGVINADNFYRPYGEGNIYCSARDLFIFDRAITSGKIIPEDLVAALFSPYELMDGEKSNYGLGWRIHNDDKATKVMLLGDGRGSRSIWEKDLTNDRVFIYIHVNSTNYQEPVYQAVQDIWASRPYYVPEKRTIYPIDTKLYKNYVGSYLSEVFGLLHITEVNGKLYLRPDPVPGKEELVPSSDTTFFFADQPIEWEFFKNNKGEVIGLGFKGDRAKMGLKQK